MSSDFVSNRSEWHDKYTEETGNRYNAGRYETQDFREWLRDQIFDHDPRITSLSVEEKHLLYNIESGGKKALSRGKEVQDYKKWEKEKEKDEVALPEGEYFYIFYSPLKKDETIFQSVYVIAPNEKKAIETAKEKSKDALKNYDIVGREKVDTMDNIEAKNMQKGWHVWKKHTY